MAIRPLVPAGIEIVLQAREFQSVRLNVLHASAGGNTPSAQELTLAARTVRQEIENWLVLYSAFVEFEYVKATDISQPEGQTAVDVFSAISGSRAGLPAPSNSAACVSISSVHGGRSGHGRIYQYGLVADNIEPGDTLKATYRAGVINMWSAINNQMTGAGLPLCVFSRKHLALYPWQSVYMDAPTDSQRRRLAGRGR